MYSIYGVEVLRDSNGGNSPRDFVRSPTKSFAKNAEIRDLSKASKAFSQILCSEMRVAFQLSSLASGDGRNLRHIQPFLKQLLLAHRIWHHIRREVFCAVILRGA